MDNAILIYIVIGGVILFGALAWYLRVVGRKELLEEARRQTETPVTTAAPTKLNPEMTRLQLQAYERLIILCDRIGLQNLVNRFSLADMSAAQLQNTLVQTIKTEFEYNISQQLYVSPTAWDAVKNLKEQNIFIINQVTSMLPSDASGLDLGKNLLTLLSEDEHASLQQIVTTLLNNDVRKILQA
ncbi:MAG: hypothetical protein ACOVP6_01175 [Lacibacter sp.]